MNKRTNTSKSRKAEVKSLGSPATKIPGKTVAQTFEVRGRHVSLDGQGRVRLNDLHKAGGFSVNKTPSDWTALEVTRELIIKVYEKTTGKSGSWSKSEMLSVLCTKMGTGGGTWVHPNLALAYAKYLSPDLHYEVNEVFLRYRSGDADLAEEVLEKSSEAENERVGIRALGRAKRKRFAAVLYDHEVTVPKDFGIITNTMYGSLFGKNAQQIRAAKGLPKKEGALRDHMSTDELVYVMASEQLASERIEDEDRRGVVECNDAARKSASRIAGAIAADRADRQPRLRP